MYNVYVYVCINLNGGNNGFLKTKNDDLLCLHCRDFLVYIIYIYYIQRVPEVASDIFECGWGGENKLKKFSDNFSFGLRLGARAVDKFS